MQYFRKPKFRVAITHRPYCIQYILIYLNSILRAAHPSSPSGLLLELEALTSVISRTSSPEVYDARASALQSGAAGLHRIQFLMLALLPRFRVPPEVNEECSDSPDSPDRAAILYYKVRLFILYNKSFLSYEVIVFSTW